MKRLVLLAVIVGVLLTGCGTYDPAGAANNACSSHDGVRDMRGPSYGWYVVTCADGYVVNANPEHP